MSASTETEPERDGSILAAISNAVVRRTAEYTGRGPTKARTTISEDLVIVLLQDTLTKGERVLVANDRAEKVLDLRGEFQMAMRRDVVADIEHIMGRKVVAFMSASHIDPDLAVEVFVLESSSNHAAPDREPSP